MHVPDDVTRFDVYYKLPWRRGLLMGGCLMVATLAGTAFLRSFGVAKRRAMQ